jgi:hypothetical protein
MLNENEKMMNMIEMKVWDCWELQKGQMTEVAADLKSVKILLSKAYSDDEVEIEEMHS